MITRRFFDVTWTIDGVTHTARRWAASGVEAMKIVWEDTRVSTSYWTFSGWRKGADVSAHLVKEGAEG
jgi:hypothetical protein